MAKAFGKLRLPRLVTSQTAISLSLLGGASAPRQLILTWSRPAFLGDCAQDFADMEAKCSARPARGCAGSCRIRPQGPAERRSAGDCGGARHGHKYASSSSRRSRHLVPIVEFLSWTECDEPTMISLARGAREPGLQRRRDPVGLARAQQPFRTLDRVLQLGEAALTSCSGSPKVPRVPVGRCATATSTLPSA
jgi:hypothetical protein